jgi:hypothetical protein
MYEVVQSDVMLCVQTIANRMKSNKVKDKRKAALKARLAKVKQRRMMNADGSVASVAAVESSDSDRDSAEEEVFGPRLTEIESAAEPEPLTRDDSWRQNAPVREWDRDKEGNFSSLLLVALR